MSNKNSLSYSHFELTEIEQFLCLCIRHIDFIEKDKIRSLYNKLDDTQVYEQAVINGVESIVGHALSECFPEDSFPALWRQKYKEVDDRISSYMDELDKVSELLAHNDILLIGLKNSGITKGIYPYYGSCPMGDIDVLVNKNDFLKAHKILSQKGYKLKFRSPLEEDTLETALESGGAEYSVLLPNKKNLWFELQFRPVSGRWIQPEQEPDVDALIEDSIPIEGSAVRLLSPEDNLLQVALHTAKHSFVRAPGFRLHTDVDRVVSGQEIEWASFTDKVKKLKICTAVFLSLYMARSLLGTPIPDHVFETLHPPKWKVRLMLNWIQRVGIFDPDAPKWSRIGYIIFVILLFDNFSSVLKGIFPQPNQLKEQYQFQNSFLLPYYYVRRIGNLIFRRVGI